MGAKASTAGASSSTALASEAGSSGARSRTLSTSAGAADSGLGLLRSASQGASGSSGVPGVVGVPNNNSVVRERVGDRGRTRSLSSVPGASNGAATMSIPTLLSRATGSGISAIGASSGGNGSETEGSSPEDYMMEASLRSFGLGRVFATHSLPAHLWSFNGFKCPVCSKLVLADDLECHLVICLTKPRISYNEDVLCEDKGECVICLEDLSQGDTIARLPCLCIYHKACIDEWFQVNRSCPEHPYD